MAQVHWTDRHVEDRARLAGPGADPVEYQRDRRRDRVHRAVLTNGVLRFYGLRVEDWGGSKYLLRDGKGRSEIVQDRGSLWSVAEKLAGRPHDPLDCALLAALSPDGLRDGYPDGSPEDDGG